VSPAVREEGGKEVAQAEDHEAESLGVQRYPVAPALHGVVVGGERGEAVLRRLLVLSAVAASTRS